MKSWLSPTSDASKGVFPGILIVLFSMAMRHPVPGWRIVYLPVDVCTVDKLWRWLRIVREETSREDKVLHTSAGITILEFVFPCSSVSGLRGEKIVQDCEYFLSASPLDLATSKGMDDMKWSACTIFYLMKRGILGLNPIAGRSLC